MARGVGDVVQWAKMKAASYLIVFIQMFRRSIVVLLRRRDEVMLQTLHAALLRAELEARRPRVLRSVLLLHLLLS